jgi:cytochrome c oxidase subunit 4
MSDHDTKKGIVIYIGVFLALIIGTILTVGAWKLKMPTIFLTILVALVIATIKASLVAGWFMHLAHEKKLIYTILGFTAFFFAGMMGLTLWAMHDIPAHALP